MTFTMGGGWVGSFRITAAGGVDSVVCKVKR